MTAAQTRGVGQRPWRATRGLDCEVGQGHAMVKIVDAVVFAVSFVA